MKTLRTLLYLLPPLAALLGGCRGGESDYRLDGEVTGLDSGRVMVVIADTAYSRIDTLRAEGGRFSYELRPDTTVELLLVFPSGRSATVFAEPGAHTTLAADTARWDSLRLSGGPLNDALQQFADSTRGWDAASVRRAVKDYIGRHPFSPVGAHLLEKHYARLPHPPYAAIDSCIELMSGRLQDNPTVQALSARLDDVMKADTGRYISSFRTRGADGKYINAYQHGGKYLLVTFWASWMPGGRELQQGILALKERTDKSKAKVAYINIALDTDRRTWLDLARGDSLPALQGCDFDGWEGVTARRFGVGSLPLMVLLSPQRRVLMRSASLPAVEARLDSLLTHDRLKASHTNH